MDVRPSALKHGALLEVITARHDDGETAIHAMAMRPRYRRLLPKG